MGNSNLTPVSKLTEQGKNAAEGVQSIVATKSPEVVDVGWSSWSHVRFARKEVVGAVVAVAEGGCVGFASCVTLYAKKKVKLASFTLR